jgi:hypothetical protein
MSSFVIPLTSSVVATKAFLNMQGDAAPVASPLVLYTVPPGKAGWYWLFGIETTLQAATTSSTLPPCIATFTPTLDAPFSPSQFLGGANTAVGYVISQFTERTAAEGSIVSVTLGGYVSVGATPLIYSARLVLAYMGPA